MLLPACLAALSAVLRTRSVSNGPGSRLLIVTLCFTICRDRPATKPVRPARAPFDMPRIGIGDFTEAEVMFTMRPNLREIMPSTVALISSIGVSMLSFSALFQSSSDQSRKSPGGGPPALVTRMSGAGQAASSLARPSGVVTSQAMAVTLAPVSLRISSAVASSASAPRAEITSSTPSPASARAQPLPRPLLEAQTIALRPLMPISMDQFPSCLLSSSCRTGMSASSGHSCERISRASGTVMLRREASAARSSRSTMARR